MRQSKRGTNLSLMVRQAVNRSMIEIMNVDSNASCGIDRRRVRNINSASSTAIFRVRGVRAPIGLSKKAVDLLQIQLERNMPPYRLDVFAPTP